MKYGDLTLGQIEALVNRLGGMTAVDVILQNESISGAVAKLLIPKVFSYHIEVNRDRALATMIEDGRYDFVSCHENITERHFPIERSGRAETDIEVIRYGRKMRRSHVDEDLGDRGLRSAKIEELLALGAAKPDLQRDFPIAALGTVWHSAPSLAHCPILTQIESKRILTTTWCEAHSQDPLWFDETYGFAAVPKAI